jgi:glycosyltransferase involved in cell wall biosynthesis
MRIVICWTDISGYMAVSWRALAARPGVSLRIVCFAPSSGTVAPYEQGIVAGLDVHFLTPDQVNDPDAVRAKVVEFNPDAVLIAGWAYKSYTRLVGDPALPRCRFGMSMDTPLKHTLRQRLARLKIGGLLDRLDRVFVIGERAWQLARRMRVPEGKIRRGMCGCDYDAFAAAAQNRPNPVPRRLVYAGRYTDAKGIDTLLAAYAQYRNQVQGQDPFTLTCCGKGELAPLLASAPGVTDRGFVQPANQPALFADHGAFVIASRYEPWGVVLAEAAASGLPIICTESCGASVEMVRDFYNGMTVPTDDPPALARALRWADDNHHNLAEMGRRSQVFGASHSAQLWAQRVYSMFEPTPQ